MYELIKHSPLILASGSPIRASLLKSLGLEFDVVTSHVDEDLIKKQHGDGNFFNLGAKLAREKALSVSKMYPEHVIIAADQLCIFNDKLFDKPGTKENAKTQLGLLQGHSHQQVSCICIMKDQIVLHEFADIAVLKIRQLGEDTIHHYIETDTPIHCCGSYQFEGLGKWLFASLDGHESTVLGLPLLPLSEALLELGIVRLA